MNAEPTSEPTPKTYEMKAIPGKGRGLVALVPIPKGTRIIAETPLFVIQKTHDAALNTAVIAKLKTLPTNTQCDFLVLHNAFGDRPNRFANIVNTNALPCGPGSTSGGLYEILCTINHSCAPNAHAAWNPDAGHETLHAIRDISQGEEITIGYKLDGTRKERRAALKRDFGFLCECDACAFAACGLAGSDERRAKIQYLDETIGNPMRMMRDPCAVLEDCCALLALLNEEYAAPGAAVARLYYDAFQVASAHGGRERAKVFAQRSYDCRRMCEGEDHPETCRMKTFTADPAKHPGFGAYGNRLVSHDLPPKDDAAFEKWLWMTK